MEELCRVKGLIICFQKGQRERERGMCGRTGEGVCHRLEKEEGKYFQ